MIGVNHGNAINRISVEKNEPRKGVGSANSPSPSRSRRVGTLMTSFISVALVDENRLWNEGLVKTDASSLDDSRFTDDCDALMTGMVD